MCMTIGCCRGSHTFACVSCRTTAKGAYQKPSTLSSWGRKFTNKTERPVCPRCRQSMRDLGFHTRIPRRRQWRRLERFLGAKRTMSR